MQAAETLDLPEVYVVAHLAALWTWALDNAPDGILPTSRQIIGKAAQWSGDPTAFVNAIFDAGFLDGDEEGRTLIHDWHSYAGRLVEKREENAERMRRARASNKEARAESVQGTFVARAGANSTPAPVKAPEEARAESVQGTFVARAGATVPYRTVPYPTEQDKSPPSEGDAREFSAIKPSRKPFKKPDEAECLEYFTLKEHPEFSVKFWNYWESVGWKRNRQPMVDWHAAARNWIAEEAQRQEARSPPRAAPAVHPMKAGLASAAEYEANRIRRITKGTEK